MDDIKNDECFFKVLNKSNHQTHTYRRGVILSQLQTPCTPLVCKMILPDPLTIYHISKIQKKLFLCISYSSVLPCMPMLEEYEKKSKLNQTLKKFVDYEDAITLISLHNPFIENSKIENGNFLFYVNSSKYELDLHTTKKIINLIKPSISIIPCELMKMNKLTKLSTRKRKRAKDQYKIYHEGFKDSTETTNLVSTNHPVVNYDKNDVFPGVDYSGFGYGESLDERGELLKSLIDKTSEDKLRILYLNTGTPLEILHAVLLGIDIVVTGYSEILSSDGCAVYFKIPEEIETNVDLASVLKLLDENCKFNDGSYEDNTNSYIDLNDSVYFNEINKPLHENSIRRESRSYVHHLIQCKEMSAEIILSSHNLWMYVVLFEKIRECIENNTLIGFVYSFIKLNVK